MKLHSYLMREAFKDKNWSAAADLLLAHFNVSGCRRFNYGLGIFASSQSKSSITLWDKKFRYEWCASNGFMVAPLSYHTLVFSIRDGEL